MFDGNLAIELCSTSVCFIKGRGRKKTLKRTKKTSKETKQNKHTFQKTPPPQKKKESRTKNRQINNISKAQQATKQTKQNKQQQQKTKFRNKYINEKGGRHNRQTNKWMDAEARQLVNRRTAEWTKIKATNDRQDERTNQ